MSAPRCTVCAAMVAASLELHATRPSPVHWALRGAPLTTRAQGATFPVELTAAIDAGWHLYALDEPDGGPLATEITLAPTDPYTLLHVAEDPPPQRISDPFYRQPLGLFTRRVHFTLELRTGDAAIPPGTKLHVRVRYQACSTTVCLPPQTEDLVFP